MENSHLRIRSTACNTGRHTYTYLRHEIKTYGRQFGTVLCLIHIPSVIRFLIVILIDTHDRYSLTGIEAHTRGALVVMVVAHQNYGLFMRIGSRGHCIYQCSNAGVDLPAVIGTAYCASQSGSIAVGIGIRHLIRSVRQVESIGHIGLYGNGSHAVRHNIVTALGEYVRVRGCVVYILDSAVAVCKVVVCQRARCAARYRYDLPTGTDLAVIPGPARILVGERKHHLTPCKVIVKGIHIGYGKT